jgi:hypothetical protein
VVAPVALGSVVDGVVAVLGLVASGDSLIEPLADGSWAEGAAAEGSLADEGSVGDAGSAVAEPLGSVVVIGSVADGSVGLAGSVAIDSSESEVGRSLVSTSLSDCANAGAAKLRQTAKKPVAIRW